MFEVIASHESKIDVIKIETEKLYIMDYFKTSPVNCGIYIYLLSSFEEEKILTQPGQRFNTASMDSSMLDPPV